MVSNLDLEAGDAITPIDTKTFRERMDRLREQEAMAKLERYDAELEDLDAWAAASSLRAFEH